MSSPTAILAEPSGLEHPVYPGSICVFITLASYTYNVVHPPRLYLVFEPMLRLLLL